MRGNDQVYPGPSCSRGIDLRTWLAGTIAAGIAAAVDGTPEEIAEEAVAIANAVVRKLGGGGDNGQQGKKQQHRHRHARQ